MTILQKLSLGHSRCCQSEPVTGAVSSLAKKRGQLARISTRHHSSNLSSALLLCFSQPSTPTSPSSLPLTPPVTPLTTTGWTNSDVDSFTHKTPQHSSSKTFELKSITPLTKIWINSNESKFIFALGFLNKSWLLFTKINPDQFGNFFMYWISLFLYQPKRATQSLWAISIPMQCAVARHITGSTCTFASCTHTYTPMFYSSFWTRFSIIRAPNLVFTVATTNANHIAVQCYTYNKNIWKHLKQLYQKTD